MTGGGHYAPARAIANTINNQKGKNVEVVLHDGLKDSPPFLRKIIEDGYKKSISKALWSFELLYAINKIKPVSLLLIDIVNYYVKPAIREILLKEQADKIIICHFMLIRPVNEILQERKLKTPVVVLVTDPFTAPSVWFHFNDQKYIVFSDSLKDKCVRKGIADTNIRVFPFVTDEKFSLHHNLDLNLKLRKDLGFSESSKVVLIMGGGEGMPRGEKIFKRLISVGIEADIIVVCGRNKQLFKQLMELKIKYKLNNARIFGFVDFVDSLIRISDVVITKAGPSVIMEILLAGKVPVINNYIWEQEKGNMEYVRDEGLGIYNKDTRMLPGLVQRLLKDPEYYNFHSENIKKKMIRNGVEQVSEYIMNFN